MGSRNKPPTERKNGESSLMDDFVFIPITGREAARGRGVSNTLVRARVTQIRHAQSNSQRVSKNLQRWAIKSYTPPKSESDNTKHPLRGSASGSREETPDESEVEEISTFEWCSTSVCLRSNNPREHRTIKSESEIPAPKLPVGGHNSDPFWTYPIDYEPSLSPLFAHYIQNIAVENPDIDGFGERNLVRRRYFPMIMTDPAAMYAVLLMSAAHFHAVDPVNSKAIDVVHLKIRALSEINVALDDPSRALTDQTVAAVVKMAAYEAVFGDSEVFAAHMRGLRLMLKMRGGLRELGLGGLLERMVVWIDLNAAHVTGLSRTFYKGDADLPTVVEFDGPDPWSFTGMS